MLDPNRANPGELVLHDETHVRLYAAPALAKADNAKAAEEGNSTRDPSRPWGDTPLGTYGPTNIEFYDDRTPIGEAGIPLPLESATGAQASAANANGRHGLYIHAGRGSGRLRPSYGCVRVLFGDFVRLLDLIGTHEIMVHIEEKKK